MKEQIKDEAIHWATLRKEGFSESQEKEFELWLEKSDLHKKAFNEANVIYSIFKNIPKEQSEFLSKQSHKSIRKMKFIDRTVKPLIGFAAILACLFIGYKFFIPNYTQSYHTAFNAIKNDLLPDGTKISVDTNTKLSVSYFNNRRKVLLENGQAFFEVAKDENKPFIIDSGKTKIEVVGTKFEVRNLDNITTVNVKEGAVKVSFDTSLIRPNKDISILKQGDKVIISDIGVLQYIGKTPIEEIAPWEHDEIIFSKTTLKEAFKSFSRYQNLEIEFKNKKFEDKLFSGKFNTLEVDRFIFAIQKIYPVKVIKNGNKVEIN
ncbi:FecR family protein [Aliarcobacter lanthieri]|uniref:FecR family protein n=1 Tax=Aliarcobacter lanthieri TaxID=1355374 RepID=UPI003AB08874